MTLGTLRQRKCLVCVAFVHLCAWFKKKKNKYFELQMCLQYHLFSAIMKIM